MYGEKLTPATQEKHLHPLRRHRQCILLHCSLTSSHSCQDRSYVELVVLILESARQRIITSMMAPFMSCGARLPVYALFAAVFFPGEGANVVFGLYLIGIVAAVVTGLFLRWSLLPGQVGMTVMELPNYEWPKARFLAKRVAERTRQFVVGAGKVIVIMVTILSLLNTIGMDGSIGNDDSDNSLLSRAAQSITPIFTPMGIRDENWPATVGIITGLFAKEAVVGTLNSLYAPETGADEESWEPWLAFIEANLSISQNLLGIPYTDPLGVGLVNQENREQAVEELEVSMESLSSLQVAFGSSAAAVAYLLFVLLYTPCAAVLGTIAEELGKRWALFSALWSLALAYGVAVSYYQLASYGIAGVGALVLVLLVFAAALVVMRYLGAKPRQSVGDIPVFTEL